MLLTPLLTGILETALNHLLYREHHFKAAYQRLNGKILRIELSEIESPIILLFGEQRLDILGQSGDSADCIIQTNISALLKLRDRQQLSALIGDGEIKVSGDMRIVQQFAGVFDLMEWDPAQWLSPYLGDLAAQGLSQVFAKGVDGVRRGILSGQDTMAQALTEEWRLAPGALEIAWFDEEVNAIARHVEDLLSRIARLEGQQ